MILSRYRPLAVAAVLALCGCTAPTQAPASPPVPAPPSVAGDTPSRLLSDADLAAYAKSDFDRRAMMGQRIALGRHNGVLVVAEFPCSDVCPEYTKRVIHYDTAPGAACDAIGGATVVRSVPYSIAVIQKPFCVPKVLATTP